MAEILSIKKEHLLECSKLYVKVFNSEPWNDQWTLESAYKRLYDFYISANFTGYFYYENDNILGVILGNCEQFYDGIYYEIKELFVDNEQQGKKIGSILLEEAERRLKEINVTSIFLLTSRGNKTNEFYRKNHYLENDSMVVMGKKINS
jgi:GNAT superfamily N-acetyltransferase